MLVSHLSQIIVICYRQISITSAVFLRVLLSAAAAVVAATTTTIDFRSLNRTEQQYNYTYIFAFSFSCYLRPRSALTEYSFVGNSVGFITSGKGGGTCFCPRLSDCLSVCLSVSKITYACTDLNEMLRVDRCRDMDELINFWARSGLQSGCRNRIAFSDIAYRRYMASASTECPSSCSWFHPCIIVWIFVLWIL